jgi:pimeloyl-ACP methyl ester carboxylesterase
MSNPANPRFARLPDGRRLAYLSAGPPDGALVLYLHGAIGSPQHACPELDAVVEELGIRYIMVSRPGFGGSDPLPGRTLLGFAADIAALAEQLGSERFAVVGVSAGGPYALACAHELPERVAVAAVVSSMSPSPGAQLGGGLGLPARAALRVLRRHPRACARAAAAVLEVVRRHPRLVARIMTAGAAPADRRRLDESESRELAAARFLAAAGGGVAGMIDDYLLCSGSWGFQLCDVRVPVQLWHGVQDPLVPVDEALHMATALPRVQTALDPDEGHFFYRRRLREIVAEINSILAPGGDRDMTPSRALTAAGSPAGRGSR